MATYREIAEIEYTTTEGLRLAFATALSSNPEAIAEGATGAPKIQSDGLGVDVVNLAIARDCIAGDIGTYAMLRSSTDPHSFGDTLAGSSLYPAGAYRLSGLSSRAFYPAFSAAPVSGTWECMGIATSSGSIPVTIWLRVL